MRLPIDILDIRVSHSCACMCSAMAIVCACNRKDLYVRVSGGFPFDDTSWAVSAIVRVWKLHVLLITIGFMYTCSRLLLCCSIACLCGSYIVCMLSIMSIVLLSVGYLHSMI